MKEEVCWNLLLVSTVVGPDRYRRMSHDHPPREIVTLPRWPTRIYKSSVRASRHLPQLFKRQGQEGDHLGENGWRRLLEDRREWLLPSHHPPQRSDPPPQEGGSVPPPAGPPVPPAGGVAGGAPDPGDSSGDDEEDGEPNPRRYPNRWKNWHRKKMKKDSEMAGFVDAVRAIVGKDKKKDDEPISTGKSPDPQSFDGNPEELERFLRQLSNKFALERRHYKQDIDKIRYASLLLKGNAAKWYEVYHLHIDSSAADYIRGRHEPLDASFATWDRFVASLRSSLGSRLPREKAVREFEKLEHSKGIDAFLNELTRLIWQTGYSDDVVKDKISRSLNKELSKDWSKVLDKPDSLAGWLIRLREMGHNNERWEEQYGNSKSLSQSAKASGSKKGEGSKGNGGNQKGSGDSSKGKKRDGGWKDKSVELKGIPKKLLDERGDANKCLKSAERIAISGLSVGPRSQ
jgi:hypothetical protein